jgi:hypothetical protein
MTNAGRGGSRNSPLVPVVLGIIGAVLLALLLCLLVLCCRRQPVDGEEEEEEKNERKNKRSSKAVRATPVAVERRMDQAASAPSFSPGQPDAGIELGVDIEFAGLGCGQEQVEPEGEGEAVPIPEFWDTPVEDTHGASTRHYRRRRVRNDETRTENSGMEKGSGRGMRGKKTGRKKKRVGRKHTAGFGENAAPLLQQEDAAPQLQQEDAAAQLQQEATPQLQQEDVAAQLSHHSRKLSHHSRKPSHHSRKGPKGKTLKSQRQADARKKAKKTRRKKRRKEVSSHSPGEIGGDGAS